MQRWSLEAIAIVGFEATPNRSSFSANVVCCSRCVVRNRASRYSPGQLVALSGRLRRRVEDGELDSRLGAEARRNNEFRYTRRALVRRVRDALPQDDGWASHGKPHPHGCGFTCGWQLALILVEAYCDSNLVFAPICPL